MLLELQPFGHHAAEFFLADECVLEDFETVDNLT
jgi:hypothetical protein